MAVLHKKLSTRSVLLLICPAFSEKKLAKIREKSFSEAEKVKRICIFWPVFRCVAPVEAPSARGMPPRDRKKRKRKKGSARGIFFDFLYNLYKNKRAIVGGSYT